MPNILRIEKPNNISHLAGPSTVPDIFRALLGTQILPPRQISVVVSGRLLLLGERREQSFRGTARGVNRKHSFSLDVCTDTTY